MTAPSHSPSTLRTISDDLAAIVARLAPSVVAVHARHRLASSGFAWREGVIVTAAHTVKREEGISVALPDGSTAAAVLAGRDTGTDIAILKLDRGAVELPSLADASSLKVGNLVVAIARLGRGHMSADFGLVAGVGSAWRTWRGGSVDRWISLDGGLRAGFSGAPLVDAGGQVVGLCTSALLRGAGVVIPNATVSRVAEELLAKGRVARGYLGLSMQPVELPQSWVTQMSLASKRALVVVSLEPGAPAEQAGILIGDVLLALGDKATVDTDAVLAILGSERVGSSLRASLIRGGARIEHTIIVGERTQRDGCR